MKRQLLVVLLLLPTMLYAQKEGQALVDSLVKALQIVKSDTGKIELESRLTFEYANSDPDEGIKYGLEALKQARKIKYEAGMEHLYNALGVIYLQKSDFPKGLEYFFLSLKMSEEKGNKNDIQIKLYNISSAYFNMGDFAKALDYSKRSLKIAEEQHDSTSMGSNLSNIGAAYAELGDTAKSLQYLFRALAILEKSKNTPITAATLQHISASYVDEKNYPKALEYGARAQKLFEAMGDSNGIALNCLALGTAYLNMATDTANRKAKPESGKYLQQAITYLQKSQGVFEAIANLDGLQDADKCLSQAYELSGDYKDAHSTYKAYVKLKDSVFSNDNKIKLAKLETQRESQLKEQQIKVNKLEKILFTTGACLLLAIILVLIRIFVVQRNANKIKGEMLRQKDVLMKEIHHRVKNNLQVISALLDLQVTNIADERAKSAMSESNTRIRSISLIHQQLYQTENINAIEFAKFAKDLMHQVTVLFEKSEQSIVLKTSMQVTLLDIDTAVPLGLILNELMTNSYKYAFVNTNTGFIEINLEHAGDYRLTYKDSGPGLPPDTDIRSMKGLGMRVIRSLSKQIGGTFSYNDDDKTFVITFKDHAARKMMD